nr:putative uncharacterized protein FRMD6-AS1 [Pan paniscus]
MGRAERAQTPGSCSYLGESLEHQALGSLVSPLSLPTGAEPAPLLSAPWPRQPEERSASAPPPTHASRPDPPPESPPPETPPPTRPNWPRRQPSRGSCALSSRQYGECPPAPPWTQPRVPRRGAATWGQEKAEYATPLGTQEARRASGGRGGVDHGDQGLSPCCGDGGARGRRRLPTFWPSGLLRLRLDSLGALPPEPSRAGRGRLFGLSVVLLKRNAGGEATPRGGGPRRRRLRESCSPLPARHSRRRASWVSRWMEGAPPRMPSLPR